MIFYIYKLFINVLIDKFYFKMSNVDRACTVKINSKTRLIYN